MSASLLRIADSERPLVAVGGAAAKQTRILQPFGPRTPLGRAFMGLLLLLIVLSCASGPGYELPPTERPAVPLESTPSQRAADQRASLGHVFYRGNALPPAPSERELRTLERDFAEAPPVEVEELLGLYGDDRELLVYATRDSDGDGIRDYRVSEYRGKFFEGDLDLDGDGIRNIYDAAPYDRRIGGKDSDGDGIPDVPGSFADADGDGIPDHLDWSRRKPDPLPSLQTGLFRDFRVILVERDARFTPELVRAFDDVLRLVYREPLPTLRTIAIEQQLLLDPDLGDNGFMLGQTQTLSIFAKSIEDAPPLVLLGLVAHEVDHAWQLALDYDAGALAEENVKIHFPPGKFTRSLERYGWEIDEQSLEGGYVHRLYSPHFYATAPRHKYRGESPKAWQAWLDEIADEAGSDYLRDPRVVRRNLIGHYSLTSPWEWHADHVMASLYNRMERSLAKHPNPAVRKSAPLLRARMIETVQGQWHRFDYRNSLNTGIEQALAQRFPLADEALLHLVNRYTLPLVDLPALASVLMIEGQTYRIEPSLLQGNWESLREHVQDPLREAASGFVEVGALLRDNVAPWAEDSFGGRHDSGAPGFDGGGDADTEPAPAAEEPAAVEPSAAPSEPTPMDEGQPPSEPPTAAADDDASIREGAELVPGTPTGPMAQPMIRLLDYLRTPGPLRRPIEAIDLLEPAAPDEPEPDASVEQPSPSE